MISEPGQSFEDIDRLRLTIFQQDWWLKIAKGSARLKEVQVLDTNGAVVGSLTYIVQRNALGIPLGRGPDLSRVSGPILGKNLSDEEKLVVLAKLIKKLPNISFTFSIADHAPDASLIRQAFKSAGFECFEQLNYSQPPEAVVSRLGTKLREHIKQAHRKLNVVSIGPEEFINFYRANLTATDKKSYFSLDVAKALITAGINRDRPQARIIAASRKRSERFSEQPVIDAAICIVWDNERCYYWLSTRRKDSHPDAIKLLIVSAMKHTQRLGLVFDADGVNTPGTQRLFKTILRMPVEETRHIFIRTPRLVKLYEIYRYKIYKLKKLTIAISPGSVGASIPGAWARGWLMLSRRSARALFGPTDVAR
jgi:hypothetical protein